MEQLSQNQIRISAAPLPFSNFQVKSGAPIGTSVADIVGQVVHHRYMGKVNIVASINGSPIFPKYWHVTRPKAGTIVNVRVVPRGGGGGKNPLATVLSIAVMIAAPYAAGALATSGALAVFGGGVATMGQVALVRGVLTAAFTVLGSLAVRALSPPPKPASATTGSMSNPAESPTQFIEGATNSINPFGVVPICLGTNRFFPLQCAKPYTETQDNDNYVRQLMTWGYGAQIQVTNLKIGDTDLSEFSDVELNHRFNGDLNAGTALFSNSVNQDNYNVLLNEPDGFTLRAVSPNSDEAIVDVTWPQGLGGVNGSSGGRFSLTINLELQYRLSGSSDPWVTVPTNAVVASQSEALVRSFRFTFPATGDYDVQIRRVTTTFPDDGNIYQQDTYLSAIRGVRHVNPINLGGINGTAIRIRATDQLNGAVDQFNGIVSNLIPDYDVASNTWITRTTSNPASVYRYVLQGYPNAKALPDAKLVLPDFEAWHTFCVSKGYTYDRVIDYDTSVQDLLQDIASAGAATPAIVDGKRTVVVDNEKDTIVQMITPRNSWGYSGELVYPELPHGFRVQFRNKDQGYAQDERIVYADGYDASNATLFETLEISSCTSSDLAWKAGRRYLANAQLRPETHTFYMDIENLVALRGDRVKLEHDVPLVGVGDARIKSITVSDSVNVVDGVAPDNVVDDVDEDNVIDHAEGNQVQSITLDDTIAIPAPGTYFMRIRKQDGTQLYKQIDAPAAGYFTSFNFSEPFSVDEIPAVGDLCYVVQAGGELDLIISRIEPGPDLSAKITAIDYASGIFNSDTGVIPSFDSHITVPLEFLQPVPPVLLNSQSDETVLLKNPDGSFTSRAIFTLQNLNEGQITAEVKVRPSGTTQFQNANVLESKPDRVSITGLLENTRYDVWIRYRRAGTLTYSLPLQINSFLYVGSSGLPTDVTNFRLAVLNDSGLFTWDANKDVDFAFYRMRFSQLVEEVTWGTSQLIEDEIFTNRITLPYQGGTYLIKAVDLSGNESETAAIVTTYNAALTNAVAIAQEDPTFDGDKTNIEVVSGAIRLADPNTAQGTYVFANRIDLQDVYTSTVSAAIVANGVAIVDDSSFNLDIFLMEDLMAVPDLFGLSVGSWSILLEFRFTQDDPDDSGATWTDWAEFIAGSYLGRAYEFRVQLYSLEFGVSPQISKLAVTVDMPDRIERLTGETVDAVDGLRIDYTPPFKSDPSVWTTLQNGQEGDRLDYSSKDEEGFTLKIYNTLSASYVERIVDIGASGYGRKTT